eukprot:15755800-Heterocapsa_arctica.AAC.1
MIAVLASSTALTKRGGHNRMRALCGQRTCVPDDKGVADGDRVGDGACRPGDGVGGWHVVGLGDCIQAGGQWELHAL